MEGGTNGRTLYSLVACYPPTDMMIVAHYDGNNKNNSSNFCSTTSINIGEPRESIDKARKEKVIFFCMRECDAKKTKSKKNN